MGYLDFNIDLPPGESFAPDAGRVDEIAAMLPGGRLAVAPRASDRSAWDPWRDHPFGGRVLEEARRLAREPYPELNDRAYLDCLEKRDVTHINKVTPVVRRRQVAFTLAECIHATGEFLDLLAADARQLFTLRSWVHPNNDMQRRNFDGATIEVDLSSAHFATNLTLARHLLHGRLSAEADAAIEAEIERRFFSPFRERIEAGRDIYWWTTVKHNWNSVCLCCYAHAALAARDERREQAWWIALVESLVRHFRDGFTDDGVCLEGVSYWSYGFGHYLSLTEVIATATGGRIDLMDHPRMQAAARFPDRCEILDGRFPTYADCALEVRPLPWARVWLENRRSGKLPAGLEEAAGIDPFEGMGLHAAEEPLLWMFRSRDPRRVWRRRERPAVREWFEESGLLICRPGPETGRRFAATLLGGHNGVNHNHNDLGTFTVVLDGQMIIVDPGAETYSFRTFSPQRYESPLLNSFGHPVPVVAGRLQEEGPDRVARVTGRSFADVEDRMTLDLTSAYAVPDLESLEREFVFARTGDGAVEVTDRVVFAHPQGFETALITFLPVAMEGAGRLRIGEPGHAVQVTVDTGGAAFVVEAGVVPQEPRPKRIAIRLLEPTRQACLRVRLVPSG